jgi:hypothetical protein
MPKKIKMLFRVLAVTSLLEAFIGTVMVVLSMRTIPHVQSLFREQHPRLAPILYLMNLADLVFAGMLILAGAYLWKLQRRGLRIILFTLAIELAYFLGILVNAMRSDSAAAKLSTFSFALGLGNMGLSIQGFTGFPIVALVLVFFIYRYLGIQARPSE